jgi:hypothetical protein
MKEKRKSDNILKDEGKNENRKLDALDLTLTKEFLLEEKTINNCGVCNKKVHWWQRSIRPFSTIFHLKCLENVK